MKKINFDLLKIVLTPKEMRDVTGGNCNVRCNNETFEIICDSFLDCESQAYAHCGDGGWMTDCW